jgi:hypothetical protein
MRTFFPRGRVRLAERDLHSDGVLEGEGGRRTTRFVGVALRSLIGRRRCRIAARGVGLRDL